MMAQWRFSLALLLVALVGRPSMADEKSVDYEREILPLFQEHCYQCHDGRKQTSGYRIDIRSRAAHGGDSGEKAIVPGQASESELVKRISSTDADEVMPPKDKGHPLTGEQVALVRRWVEQGANWPDKLSNEDRLAKHHWAFVAPKRPALPEVKNDAWVRSPIDRFILARLEAEGIKPSAEADRVTLLRRLSLDLVGLTPTIEEVNSFVGDKADSSDDAYLRVVEQLLASPHYGEHWGRRWLDAARYADSDGYEKDKPRFVWFYRDWVINAFNRNLPYNQFVIEQIAGDLLPNATQDQKVATGFLRNSMINEEGGVDPEQFRMEAMFDRMDAIGKGILGVTIQCAQCHDHKYDPLRQEEYYRIFAFLNNSNESAVPVYTPAEQQKIADILRRTREIEAGLERRTPDWRSRLEAWEDSLPRQPEWTVIRPEVDDISTGGQRYIPQEDGSLLAQGYAPTKHTVKLTVTTTMTDIRAFRLELLNDTNLPLGGPGRSIKGTGALTDCRIEAAPLSDPSKVTKLSIARATADINLPEAALEPMFADKSNKKRVTGPIEYAIDGKDETAWGFDAGPGLRNQPRKAVFNLTEPIANPGGVVLTIYVKQNAGGWNSDDNQNNNLGRIRLSITSAADAVADPLPAGVRAILSVPRAERSDRQWQTIFGYWRTTVPEWRAENEAIAALWREYPEGASQLVLNERAQPRETHQLTRGDFLSPAKTVQPGVPSCLNPLPADAPPTRLTFANWLVARNAPTTARSFVNRLWLDYFGTGIVETAEDFGTQGAAPSHPELLDWLAVEFMDRHWDVKAMQRLIVTSATYRQSSKITPEVLAKDPYNRMLARGPRFRVDAEIVRDIALAASGLLNPEVGGPSVFPPAPDFLFNPPASYSKKPWNESTGADRY